MKFFKPESAVSGNQAVEGHRPFDLPLVTCPHCGNFRGMAGVAYPGMEIQKIVDERQREAMNWSDSNDFTWEEYVTFVSRIRPALEPNYVLPPGAEFGPFKGKIYARPTVTDFVMPDPSMVLVRRRVAQQLNELGNKLRIFETKLTQQRKGAVEDLVEIWAPAIARAGRSAAVKWCEHCQRGSGWQFDILDANSVPPAENVVMMRDRPHFLILTEKLATDIQANGFTGLLLKPFPSE